MMVEYIPRLIERKHCALLPLLCTAPCKRKISTTKNNRSWTSGTRIRGMVLDNFFSQLLLTCFFLLQSVFLSLIRRRRRSATMTGPVGVVEDARLFQQFVSVSAEVVTLSLDEVGGQSLAAVGVVEGEGGGEGGHGDAPH